MTVDTNSDEPGLDFVRPIVGRGLATADYDNDGDIDIVTNNRGDFPSLLGNDGGNANHWLTPQLVGTKSFTFPLPELRTPKIHPSTRARARKVGVQEDREVVVVVGPG